MNCFPDTSFLCSVYRTQQHSPKADAFMAARTGPLPVSTFLLLEFRQSVRLHAADRDGKRLQETEMRSGGGTPVLEIDFGICGHKMSPR